VPPRRTLVSRSLLALILLPLFGISPAGAVAPILWTMQTLEEFEQGKPKGVAVGSRGDLALTPDLKLLNVPALDQTTEPFLWSQAVDSKGTLYVGGGRNGGVYRIPGGGTGSLYYETGDLAVHALAIDRSDVLYAGTSPEGRVYRITGEGKGEVYYHPEDRYIWSMVSAGKGELYVATGERGIIYKVLGKGKGTTFFDSEEFHVVSLALDGSGNLLAGTDGKGLLYRIDPTGVASVVHDSPLREINAIATDGRGTIYAAAIGIEGEPALPPLDRRRQAPAGQEQSPAVVANQAPVPVPGLGPTETITVTASATDPSRNGVLLPKSEVYRISPDGTAVVVWSSQTEVVYALALDPSGRPLIGTGEPGRIRALGEARQSTLLAKLPQSQVTSLAAAPGSRLFAASSNVGRVYLLDAVAGESGTYVSPPRDALTRARWGRISWRASLPAGARVEISTRSGNSSVPDATWSRWSAAYGNAAGSSVVSPPARFLQWQARLARQPQGEGPTLHAVSVAYVQANLPPVLERLQIQPPGVVRERLPYVPEINPVDLAFTGITIGSDGIPASGQATLAQKKIYVRGMRSAEWEAEDPNHDVLAYDLFFRGDEETTWKPLARGLRDRYFAFDSMQLPDGLYRLRLVASDHPSNPGDGAASVALESEAFLVDNTPPAVRVAVGQASKGSTVVIEASATDTVGPIARAEYSLDATGWVPLQPADGMSDSDSESYTFSVVPSRSGEHTVILKVIDLLGNTGAGKATFTSK
jgi:sugar lactone lactonase YvrE